MIKKIINASLKDKFMVLIASVMIFVAGLYVLKNTPLDAIPDLSDVQGITQIPVLDGTQL